jgi:glycosyltransferase involved in cell wall biosynthesis
MIAKDEEQILERCIESAREIADEIVVVMDSRSSDKTKEIASRHTSKVYDFKWKDDFSAMRNLSLDKASSNWILVLDADEVLDAKGRQEILELINTKEHCLKSIVGFKLDQRTYLPKQGVEASATVDEQELKQQYEGHESSNVVRLFKNDPRIRFRNKVHELVEHSIRENGGEIVETGVVLHHFSHLKKDRLNVKAQEYVDLMWQQLEKEPENPRYNRQVGVAFLEKGRKDLAEKYLQRALRYDPNHPGIFADLGKLYLERGQPKRAAKFFNMAIAKDKGDVASMNNLAVIYMNYGKKEVAQKLLEKALEKEPGNKAVQSNLEKAKN